MKKGYIAIAVAVLAVVAGLLYISNRNAVSRGGVTVVTRANAQQEILGSDRPVILLVTSKNGCADCPAVLEALKKEVSKYPNVKFAVADAAEVGAPANTVPLILSALPGVGPTSQQANVSPADVPAYIAKRADIAGKQMSAIKKVEALEKEVAIKGKPFDDEAKAISKRAEAALAPIQARAEKALEPLQAEGEALNKRIEAALGTLPADLEKARQAQDRDEFMRIRAEIAEKVKPFQAEADALKAKMAETLKPFQAEAEAAVKPFEAELEQVAQRRSQALGTLDTDLEAAQSELMMLLLADQFGAMGGDAPADPAAPADKK